MKTFLFIILLICISTPVYAANDCTLKIRQAHVKNYEVEVHAPYKGPTCFIEAEFPLISFGKDETEIVHIGAILDQDKVTIEFKKDGVELSTKKSGRWHFSERLNEDNFLQEKVALFRVHPITLNDEPKNRMSLVLRPNNTKIAELEVLFIKRD